MNRRWRYRVGPVAIYHVIKLLRHARPHSNPKPQYLRLISGDALGLADWKPAKLVHSHVIRLTLGPANCESFRRWSNDVPAIRYTTANKVDASKPASQLTADTTMNSLRVARTVLRARPAAIRAPLQRRGYAEAVADKVRWCFYPSESFGELLYFFCVTIRRYIAQPIFTNQCQCQLQNRSS